MTELNTEITELPLGQERMRTPTDERPLHESPMPRPHVFWRAAIAMTALVCVAACGVVIANALFTPAFVGARSLAWPHSELIAVPVAGRWLLACLLLAYGISALAILGYLNRAVRTARVETGLRSLRLSSEALSSAATRTNVTFDEAVVFWQALRYPRQRFLRITETAEYGSRTVRVSSTFTVSVSDLNPGMYAIPLLQVPRGSLVHGVRFAIGDRRISSLTHPESVVYVREVVKKLVGAAGDDVLWAFHGSAKAKAGPGSKWWPFRYKVPRKHKQDAVGVPELFQLEELSGSAGSSSPQDATGLPVAELVERLIRSAGPTPTTTAKYVADRIRALKPSHPALEAAADIILALRRNYPICVPILSSSTESKAAAIAGSQRITVDRVVLPGLRPRRDSARLTGNAAHRLVGWLEAKREAIERGLNQALGVPVTALAFPLLLADSTESYHLNLRGPEGHYVAEQEILRRHDVDDGERVPRSELASLSYAMSPRQGQRTAHIYIRSGEKPGRYEYQAKFAERMPGSMATTFVGAITTLAISSAIAFATLTVHADDQASSLGLLQILLAFPLALTATSSYSHGSPFWGGDLASRLGTLITVIVLAASLWVSTAAMVADRDVIATWWAVLLTTAAANTLFTLTAWLTRVSIHRSFTP